MSLTGFGQTAKARIPRIRPARQIGLKKMNLTWKERLANWLTRSSNDSMYANEAVEVDSLNSNGLRFNLYKAHGGFVIETRSYDDRTDRNINKLYVITEDKDLGTELGKIITMESLR
jgi:hypothetical protein